MRHRDVTRLAALVTTSKQHNKLRATLDKINSVTWAVINTQLRYTSTHRFHIASIS